jgi:SET domain-containing protein
MISESLFTALTERKGWGVFSRDPIQSGTCIEVSPVVVMSAAERLLLDQTTLYHYIFEWENEQCCMAMGLVPVYNHHYQVNAEYFQDYEAGVIMIQTVRDIEAGEEITINYNGDWNDPKPVWFEVIDE